MITTRFFGPGDPLDDASAVRTAVFVQEQNFPLEVEFDNIDPTAWHVVLYDDDAPVATGRLFAKDGDCRHYIIGRVAVLRRYRGQHLGALVMERLESRAMELGADEITLGAQVTAGGFYGRLGYTPHGERFFEEHCEHIYMSKQL